MNNTYKCAVCDNEYEKGWSDEEAYAETEKYFGMHPENSDAFAVVCDDCFQKMHPKDHPELVKEAREKLQGE